MKQHYFSEDDEEILEDILIGTDGMNAMCYLHGFCNDIAMYLSKRFNYEVVMVIEYDDEIEKDALVHAFNTVEKDGERYYIDIRGITTNEDEIMQSFDLWDKPDLYGWTYEQAKQTFKEMKIPCVQTIELEQYISENIDMYSVK